MPTICALYDLKLIGESLKDTNSQCVNYIYVDQDGRSMWSYRLRPKLFVIADCGETRTFHAGNVHNVKLSTSQQRTGKL